MKLFQYNDPRVHDDAQYKFLITKDSYNFTLFRYGKLVKRTTHQLANTIAIYTTP